MKKIIAAIALIAAARLAGAGIVITEEVDQVGGPMPGKTDMTITASGDRTRIDIGKDLSSIIDIKAGTITSLMHSQKMAMKLPESMMDAIKQQAPQSKDTKPEFKPTGKKETINGFACQEYEGTLAGMKVSIWVTPDVKNAQAILDQFGKLSGNANPFKAALAGGGDLPGFPIRTVTSSPQMGKSTMTVVSIKDESVPDSAFEIPADYKSMNLPQMGNPGGSAPAVPSGGGN